jgi:hypothetical protein
LESKETPFLEEEEEEEQEEAVTGRTAEVRRKPLLFASYP